MTLDDLKAMSEREVDCLVAEKVMGWTIAKGCNWWQDKDHNMGPVCINYNPSTDIAEAFEVLGKFSEYTIDRYASGVFEVLIIMNPENACASGDSLPRTICIAALLAKGEG